MNGIKNGYRTLKEWWRNDPTFFIDGCVYVYDMDGSPHLHVPDFNWKNAWYVQEVLDQVMKEKPNLEEHKALAIALKRVNKHFREYLEKALSERCCFINWVEPAYSYGRDPAENPAIKETARIHISTRNIAGGLPLFLDGNRAMFAKVLEGRRFGRLHVGFHPSDYEDRERLEMPPWWRKETKRLGDDPSLYEDLFYKD